MCGICGIVSFSGPAASKSELDAMNSAIAHRGPDDSGCYFSPDRMAALGHRRLSIIDLTTGHQPLANEDNTVWVVFNGEIYDFQPTRKRLLEAGHKLSTSSDTEVIVHAWEDKQERCVEELGGMFAFALWDERQRVLFAARDRVGKKPFFYAEDRGRLLFASELKGVLAAMSRTPELDPEALDQYLYFGYIPAPRTIYKGIFKLPPAHWLKASSSGIVVQRYWNLEFRPEPVASEEELLEQTDKLLRQAVRERLISEVPLGALLSGGVDSSLVVALMAQEGGRPPSTFSIGFEESDFSELTYARQVAKHIGTDHHEQIVKPDALTLINELVAHYDEPYADSSMLPTFLVCKMAREKITVALSGDGGDEVFGGYPRYMYESWTQRLLSVPGAPWGARVASQFWRPNWRGYRALRKMRYPEGRRYAEQVSQLDTDTLTELCASRPMNGGSGAMRYVSEHYLPSANRAHWEPLAQLQAIDILSGYLPGDILTKVDMASMRVALEMRSPLLDHRVIEFMARVPARFKIRGTETKYLLKKLAARHVPPSVIYRKKSGFVLPLARWFRKELRTFVEDMLLSRTARTANLFSRNAVRRVISEHVESGADRAGCIFTLLSLEMWFRNHDKGFEPDPIASPRTGEIHSEVG